MQRLNFAIVGSGKSVSDSVRTLDDFNHTHPSFLADLKCVFIDQKNFVPSANVSHPVFTTDDMNDEAVLQRVLNDKIDFILSVNNHQILGRRIIEAPKRAVLNFHNGPLPRYGGVNACAWAIFNGETEHGITWHTMEERIDSGPILMQKRFPIAANETAISLIMKCISHGMSALAEMLPTLFQGGLEETPQNQTGRSYFSRKDIPAGGIFDFCWRYEEADRFMRCLNVSPFPQMLPYGKARCGDQSFQISKISKAANVASAAPGEITEITDRGIVASLSDCDILIERVLTKQNQPVEISTFINQCRAYVGQNLQFATNGAPEYEG